MLERLLRTSGEPQIRTSKILPSRYVSLTSSLATRADTARRTSPGLRPWRSAAARSTWMSICGISVCSWTWRSMIPGIASMASSSSSALTWSVSSSGPKIRIVIASLEPVSTSRMRSLR